MPTNINYQVPFNPQESTTQAILHAIQLANEHHTQQQQIGLQQQQVGMQQQSLGTNIARTEADTKLANAQTETTQFNLEARKKMFSALTGQSPDSQAPQPQMQPGMEAAPSQGIIGDTVSRLLQDSSLSSTEQQAIGLAGRQAMLKAYQDPSTAMEGIVTTYNDILRQHGDNSRAIKTDTIQDPNSSTGYSIVGTHPDGSEAYRINSQPPLPKSLAEASSLVGSAALAYRRDPTPGNQAALNLFQSQHDAMYADRMAEAAKQAEVTARARGADVEAMFRTGKNPITGEVLSLANAPPGALVNPTNGQPIPQDMIALYKPTMNERQTADTARQVLAISKDLKDEIAKNPNLIGPLAGRSQQALQKIGISAGDAAKLIDDVTFLQSAATKMHTGRFSSEILNKMSSVIKAGMGKDEFLGSLESVDDVANRYANEDKLTTVFEYQQRQQFENQQAAGPPAPAKAGGGFFEKFGGVQH